MPHAEMLPRLQVDAGERDPLTSVGGMPISVTPNSEGSNDPNSQSRNWGKGWKEDLRRNWDGVVGITLEGDILPYEDQFLDLDPVYKDNFGLPLLRLTFDFHENERNLYHFMACPAINDIKSCLACLSNYCTWA